MPGVWEGKIQVFLGLDTLIKAAGEATSTLRSLGWPWSLHEPQGQALPPGHQTAQREPSRPSLLKSPQRAGLETEPRE